jgi:hypothetical protein
MEWFSYWWYKYLFTDLQDLNQLVCRIKGHPNGIVFYNCGGLEPDTTCKDCGEELG